MPDGLLLAGALVSLLTAVVFGWIGARFIARAAGAQQPLPLRSFAWFWFGLGAFAFLGGVQALAVYAGWTPLAFFVLGRYLTLIALAGAVASFVFYVLFLFTGHRGLVWPVAVYYLLVAMVSCLHVWVRRPVDVAVAGWRVDLSYARPFEEGLFVILLALLLVPHLLAISAYGILGLRLKDATSRFRAVLVSLSLSAWFVAAVLARLAQEDWSQFVTRPGMGLLVSALLVVAYHPPASLRARWGLRTLHDELPQHPSEERDAARERRHAQVAARAQDLI